MVAQLWLKRLFNCMISLECIPSTVLIPVHKGKGRNPFNPNSYRGISLTSIIAKVLENILLRRMLPVLQENGFPHISQTAYIPG